MLKDLRNRVVQGPREGSRGNPRCGSRGSAVACARTRRSRRCPSSSHRGSAQLQRHTLAHAAEKLIGNGSGVQRYLLDGQAGTPKYDGRTDVYTRQLRDIHGNHVHRHATHQRGTMPVDQHGGTVRQIAREAIAVAAAMIATTESRSAFQVPA